MKLTFVFSIAATIVITTALAGPAEAGQQIGRAHV
mgnify:CR=1 FL=1